MFSVVKVYLDHLKFCVVCQSYVCCSECNVVGNEPSIVQPIGAHGDEVNVLGELLH